MPFDGKGRRETLLRNISKSPPVNRKPIYYTQKFMAEAIRLVPSNKAFSETSLSS